MKVRLFSVLMLMLTLLLIATTIPTTAATIYTDDFSSYSLGSAPTGWTAHGLSAHIPTVVNYGGTGSQFQRLTFAASTQAPPPPTGATPVEQEYRDYLIKDNFIWTAPTISVKLNINAVPGGEGIFLAWQDELNFIAILADPFFGEFVIWQAVNGNYGAIGGTGRYNLPISLGQDYWLKAQSTITATGVPQLDVYWSTDGVNYTLKASANPLSVAGRVGIGHFRSFAPTYFDDFSVNEAAPTYTITGRVTDGKNRPVSGVTITDAKGDQTITDLNGIYQLPGLAPGSYILMPVKGGYTFDHATQVVKLDTASAVQDFKANKVDCNSTNIEVQPASSFQFPLDTISKRYYTFKSVYVGKPYPNTYHNGVDYDLAPNANVYAVANGVVFKKVAGEKNFGNYLIIEHLLPQDSGGGVVFSLSAHLADHKDAPKPGCPVIKGQLIGHEGKTGEGSNKVYHVHFELRKPTGVNPWNTNPYPINGTDPAHDINNFYDPDLFIPAHMSAGS